MTIADLLDSGTSDKNIDVKGIGEGMKLNPYELRGSLPQFKGKNNGKPNRWAPEVERSLRC